MYKCVFLPNRITYNIKKCTALVDEQNQMIIFINTAIRAEDRIKIISIM